tara:strand:- start:15 stop:275 length:261 start_codon:yes stop_codon:yes gene_type:complete
MKTTSKKIGKYTVDLNNENDGWSIISYGDYSATLQALEMTGELCGGRADGEHIVPLADQIRIHKWVGKQSGEDYSDLYDEEDWNQY